MVQFDIITLFPSMFESPLSEGIISKAQKKGLIDIRVHDLREYTEDRHRTADDTPYGGGAGMVMKAEPLVRAIEAIKLPTGNTRTVFLTPQGALLKQERAKKLSAYSQLIILCGRYEGIDERVLSFVDEEISIGDFVLTGGEIAAMAVLDVVARLVPGVVGDAASVSEDTFSNFLLKYPQYTRPDNFRGLSVPEILLSGDHKKIAEWRSAESLKRTLKRRPDLIEKADLTDKEKKQLENIKESERLE
jgi:tRNA (guanine37-N1)-methyltransferase